MTRSARTQFVCQQCGRTAPKGLGRCPQCGAWNSMVAELAPAPRRGEARPAELRSRPRRLADIPTDGEDRIPLRIGEFSRVLGGGVVPGSVVLVAGDPGIGKSTLLLQMALDLAAQGRVLYVSGEESEGQIKGRVLRILGEDAAAASPDLHLLTETDLGAILTHATDLAPRVLVVDSVQTLSLAELEASAGSISQVREAATRLQALAKASGVAVFLVGHVTKEGAIAGPKVLEHIVDTVLYLEGDPFHAYRLLRAVKNRFGATSEVGVFEMRGSGMAEVPNPSEAFLADRVANAPGSAIAVTLEGTRPLLVEIQGLTSPTTFGTPRRTANGVDFNRLLLTLAVLTRRAGVRLGDQDVFANVVGGLQVDEPAADLALALAIASSMYDRPLPSDLALIGEVGLSGELRAVAQLPLRLREAGRLGFRQAIVPRTARKEAAWPEQVQVHAAGSVREAMRLVWKDHPASSA